MDVQLVEGTMHAKLRGRQQGVPPRYVFILATRRVESSLEYPVQS